MDIGFLKIDIKCKMSNVKYVDFTLLSSLPTLPSYSTSALKSSRETMAILEEVDDPPPRRQPQRAAPAASPNAGSFGAVSVRDVSSLTSDELLSELLKRKGDHPTELLQSVFSFLRRRTDFLGAAVRANSVHLNLYSQGWP